MYFQYKEINIIFNFKIFLMILFINDLKTKIILSIIYNYWVIFRNVQSNMQFWQLAY